VARALAMKPALLLADEATGNLDTRSTDAVFELLHTVNPNTEPRSSSSPTTWRSRRVATASVQVVDGRIVDAAATVL